MLLLAATAVAQSRPGASFDQTMSTVSSFNGRSDSATSEMHVVGAGGDSRIEVQSGKPVPNIGEFSPGTHAVIIMRDQGKQMVFLSPDQKQYLSFNASEMLERTQKMIESMGGSMTVDTSVTRISLDSLGPGPVIEGHPTLTYRLTSAVRMTMSMMGELNVVDIRSTQEIQSATDLGDFSDLSFNENPFAGLPQSMGFAKGYFEKLTAKNRKLRGFPLRSVTHSTATANGTTRMAVETIESRNIKRLLVPDSMFAIPGDYKAIPFPTMPGTGA
jgi:hypothetical protein